MDLLINNFELTALEICHQVLNVCTENTPIAEAAELIQSSKTTSILVVNGEQSVVGIWTESNSRELMQQKQCNFTTPICRLMSSPVLTIHQSMLFRDVLEKLKKNKVRHLLVVDDNNKPVGIINQSDLVSRQGIDAYLTLKTVKHNYDKKIPFVCGDNTVNQVANAMALAKTSAAIVIDKASGVCGMLTERDLLKCIASKSVQLKAWDYAAKPLIKIHEDEGLAEAYNILKRKNIRHLVVYNQDKSHAGVLSLHHVLSDMEDSYVKQLESILIERNKALTESIKSLSLAERIIDASLDSIMVTDQNANILSINPAFTELTGYSAEESIGKSASLLSSGLHDRAFYQTMWASIEKEGTWQGEITNKKKNGQVYSEWLTIIEIADPLDKNKCYAAIFSDISERKENERKIHALAFYDELSGLPNRRLFRDRAEIALSTAHRNNQYAAMMFLDLDGFKQINDNLGHSIGDNLLKETANRLARSIKEGDTVSRFGGDEFVLLLTEINEISHVDGIIERISNVLKEPYLLNDKEYQVTSSIGVAVYPCDGDNTEILLKHADTAMYQAKDNGRNNYQLYSREMNDVSMERLEMQNQLRKALKNDEFELHYQLKMDQISKQVVGLEALLRWKNTKLGNVPPSTFIPLAESLGLVVEIDKWVLKQATKQRMKWHQLGLSCGRISVNISAKHLAQDLFSSINNVLKASNLPAQLLDIEVTETSLIDNVDEAKAIFEHISRLGVSVSLDDFGTGFSALSYLTQLPLQTLKIDASFVQDVPTNKEQSQIVKTIIAMAKGLNLSVVAEGVENVEQANFLTKHDCHILQGYLYSKPMPADKIETQLIQHCRMVKSLIVVNA